MEEVHQGVEIACLVIVVGEMNLKIKNSSPWMAVVVVGNPMEEGVEEEECPD